MGSGAGRKKQGKKRVVGGREEEDDEDDDAAPEEPFNMMKAISKSVDEHWKKWGWDKE